MADGEGVALRPDFLGRFFTLFETWSIINQHLNKKINKDKFNLMAQVPALFELTEQQAENSFAAGESQAVSGRTTKFGNEKELRFRLQGGTQFKIILTFLSLSEVARRRGYLFAKRPGGTASDRADMIRALNQDIARKQKQVFLEAVVKDYSNPQGEDNTPNVGFTLVTTDGQSIDTQNRVDLDFGVGRMSTDQAAQVIFPLYKTDGTPYLTTNMDSFTVAVGTDSAGDEAVYPLR
ncbi:MAG TPA: hypothetical protein VGC76_04670 [Pyrinomonadaceae bacterium]